MLKLLVVVVILYVFRHELRRLAPHWRSVLALSAGLVVGIVYTSFLQRFGVLDQIARALGVGQGGAVLVVLVIFAIAGLKTFEPHIRNLFREGESARKNEERRRER